MTRLEIEQALQEINSLVLDGRMMDAFEKYYHEDVEMQENQMPPTISKTANRQRELEFLNNIIEFRGAEVKGFGVGDSFSFVIWKYDYTHKQWGVRDYTQVSIQEWKDRKIIKETFIYNN